MKDMSNGDKDVASRSVLDDVKMAAMMGAARGAMEMLGARARAATIGKSSDVPVADDQAANGSTEAQEGRKGSGAMLQMLGVRAGEVLHTAPNLNIDPNDVPRLMRGLTLVATGLGTIFAPGSSLDVSRPDGGELEIVEQARKGIDTANEMTQQRIKVLVDLARDSLNVLSDTLRENISTTEIKMQEALDVAEERLTQSPEAVAQRTNGASPEEQRNGGAMRWLILGVLAGGTAAYLTSPLGGQLGEQIQAMRRNAGLGGADDDGGADTTTDMGESQI
jgi:hypothetical protein